MGGWVKPKICVEYFVFAFFVNMGVCKYGCMGPVNPSYNETVYSHSEIEDCYSGFVERYNKLEKKSCPKFTSIEYNILTARIKKRSPDISELCLEEEFTIGLQST